jgi:hypothetical protein
MKDSWGDGKAWQKFERVVAGLHKFRDAGVDIRWNEKIAGRQVDVTVRFDRGGYSYLLLIECKNYADAVPVSEVEAFITKSQTLGADKAVMVAANGFQSGAEEQAGRHRIGLYTLREIEERWPVEFIKVPEPGFRLTGVLLIPASGLVLRSLPDQPEVLAALRFDLPNWPPDLTLADVAQHAKGLKVGRVRESHQFEIKFPNGCSVRHPAVGAAPLQIRALRFTATPAMVSVRNAIRPPDVPLVSYEYTDVFSGKSDRLLGTDLPIGLDTTFEVGKFYRNIFGLTYKCERVTLDEVQLFLISKQHGKNFAVRFTIEPKYAPQYVEITTRAEIAKLEAEYRRYPLA